MLKLDEYKKIKNILQPCMGEDYEDYLYQHHFWTTPSELLSWVDFLKNDLGFLTLVEITGLKADKDYEIVYQLLNMDNHQRVNIHLKISREMILPSLSDDFESTNWKERELSKTLGVSFSYDRPFHLRALKGLKNLDERSEKENKRLRLKNGISSLENVEKDFSQMSLPSLRFNPNKSEAPYKEESFKWKKLDHLSVETQGHFDCHICFDPEKIVEIRPFTGLFHQNLERSFQKKSLYQNSFLLDRLNMSSAPTYSMLWAKTLEDIFQIEIPDRAKALRMVLLELARINHHLTVLFQLTRLSNFSHFSILINLREKVYELFEKWTGSRQATGSCLVGGVRQDLPQGWIVECQMALRLIDRYLPLFHQGFMSHKEFRNLAQGPRIEAQSILNFGITGPAMRAAGINFDLRKSDPFYFYQDLEFDIPVGVFGMTYDRYLVRIEEIFQSLRLVTQIIDNIPEGDFDLYPHHQMTFSQFSDHLIQKWNYGFLEAPSGETGMMIKLKNDQNISRIKFNTPSFALVQGLDVLVRGLTQKQLAIAVSSLGLSRWEMDR